jgi:probable addiction module antidote protein
MTKKQLESTGHAEEFLQAPILQINGGMSAVSRLSNLNRENLYRMLSKKGNPALNSLNALLNALGFKLAITSVKKKKGNR